MDNSVVSLNFTYNTSFYIEINLISSINLAGMVNPKYTSRKNRKYNKEIMQIKC